MPERTLPVFERIAPTPPLALLADRIEAYTRPGEVVLDVASRGGDRDQVYVLHTEVEGRGYQADFADLLDRFAAEGWDLGPTETIAKKAHARRSLLPRLDRKSTRLNSSH